MKEARTTLYFALSEAFKEPSPEFAGDVVSGIFADEISQAFKKLGHDEPGNDLIMEEATEGQKDIVEQLLDVYYPLFKGPFPPYVVPVESVYKPWAESEVAAEDCRHEKGMLMGDSAIDILKRFEAAGIEVPQQFQPCPDHIVLILEYGAMLCEHAPEAVQKEFVESHLDWIPLLRDEIYQHTENKFYRCLADVTLSFATFETERFQNGVAA